MSNVKFNVLHDTPWLKTQRKEITPNYIKQHQSKTKDSCGHLLVHNSQSNYLIDQ